MRDPVIDALGHSYERKAIESWLANHQTSPITNQVLPHTNVVTNHALRKLILSLTDEERATIRRRASASERASPPAAVVLPFGGGRAAGAHGRGGFGRGGANGARGRGAGPSRRGGVVQRGVAPGFTPQGRPRQQARPGQQQQQQQQQRSGGPRGAAAQQHQHQHQQQQRLAQQQLQQQKAAAAQQKTQQQQHQQQQRQGAPAAAKRPAAGGATAGASSTVVPDGSDPDLAALLIPLELGRFLPQFAQVRPRSPIPRALPPSRC